MPESPGVETQWPAGKWPGAPGFAHEIMYEGQIIHHFTQRRDGFRRLRSSSGEGKGRLNPRPKPVLKRLHVFAKIVFSP